MFLADNFGMFYKMAFKFKTPHAHANKRMRALCGRSSARAVVHERLSWIRGSRTCSIMRSAFWKVQVAMIIIISVYYIVFMTYIVMYQN